MAGPLSSEEIEDVVSSVRRLVSNEHSARNLSRDLNAERLLLTPSLRVISEVSPLAPLILEDHVVPEAAEPDVSQDDTADLIEAEWEDELWGEVETVTLGEAALAAEEAEVLPSSDPGVAEAVETEIRQPPASADTATAEGKDDPIAFVPLRRRAENLAARLASGGVTDPVPSAPAEPMASEEDHSVPADHAHSEATTDPESDVAVAEEDVSAPQEELTAQRMPTEILDADGTPLAVLDEAALQEIVRLMIREELQGDLGERITRNVRKLVRAEINRALIARDLD
jgi:hypothetical protein